MAVELRERYTELVLEKLRAELVTKDNVIFNNKYEGNPTAGAVKIPVISDVKVKTYDKETGATLDYVTTSFETLLIDKDECVNELIDGYVAKAVTSQMVANRLDNAGYAMANSLDTQCLDILATGGTNLGASTTLDSSTIYEELVGVKTKLSKANVSKNGRYVIVTPETLGEMILSEQFIKESDLGQKILETGAIGLIAGFAVYESNNLPTGVDYIAGHSTCASRVMEFAVPVSINDLADGAHIGSSAVQGRNIWGAKVTHPTGILVRKTV